MIPIAIGTYNKGLQTNKKPFLLPDEAFSQLENAYVWRERVKKREGLELLGRLRRVFNTFNFFPFSTNPFNFNLLTVTGFVSTANNGNPGKITTTYPHGLTTGDIIIISGIVGATGYNNTVFTITVVDALNFTVGVNAGGFGAYVSGGFWISSRLLTATEPNASLECGSIKFTIGSGGNATVYNDDGAGNLVYGPLPNGPYTGSGTINYATGLGAISFTVVPPNPTVTTVSFNYFPGLPVMGIWQREIAPINDEQTIFWDTRYAYVNPGTGFQEFIAGTSWFGSNSDFFWTTNYRGSTPSARLLFATNFVSDLNDPMRFTDGTTWTNFTPLVDATNTLFQARILIPYYGRLLALNVFEGATVGGPGGASNIFNRCRFSQIGDPTAVDAWRSDQFGKGGFIDAPTNEEIISAIFYKNTLIVFFERTTWQLRYVGEYGLPFIWERISSDFGSGSTFSTILFDDGVLGVGDRAIISSSAVSVNRIDLDIPDIVFENFRNANAGNIRVCGIRDFQRELVFWCYSDAQDQEPGQIFPNKTLLFNYRNKTYAIFRNNVTFFGTYQPDTGLTWDSQVVTWDDNEVFWSDADTQSQFPRIVSGNQQGYIHYYGYVQKDEPSLYIQAITLSPNTSTPVNLTINNHNLNTGDIIEITNADFFPVDSSLIINGDLFQVTFIDVNTVSLQEWNGTNYQNAIRQSASAYIGCGQVTLFPVLNITTKDFNPFQQKGMQLKMSYLDVLFDGTEQNDTTQFNAISIRIFINSSLAAQGNLLTGNTQVETIPIVNNVYNQGFTSDYIWHRFYATLSGQYMRIQLTYDDSLMNSINTHEETMTLDAMILWTRPGGKLVL